MSARPRRTPDRQVAKIVRFDAKDQQILAFVAVMSIAGLFLAILDSFWPDHFIGILSVLCWAFVTPALVKLSARVWPTKSD